MRKINILMFNMSRFSDWQKGVNRNYHILHTIIKDERVHKVLAVDFFPFTWERAIKTYIKDHIVHDSRGTVLYGDLTSRCWQVTSKVLVYSTIDSMVNPKRIIPELKRILAEQGMEENLIVWSYNPLYTDYFGKFDGARYVFDAVDNWAEHSSYARYRDALLKNYDLIGAKSDRVFTVSDELRKLFDAKDTVYWIPNGVDVDHFTDTMVISPRLAAIPEPRIGFLGILQDRIDTDLIELVAREHPTASVVLAGPVWKGFPRHTLESLGNVYFTGAVPYQEIPEFYNGFAVGIIPYKINEFIRSTNSMKFYEYLAAGLPVVTTRCPGADQFEGVIAVADSATEFSRLVGTALMENRAEHAQSRLEALRGKRWKDRVETIFTQLGL